jgi:hypothetical protein
MACTCFPVLERKKGAEQDGQGARCGPLRRLTDQLLLRKMTNEPFGCILGPRRAKRANAVGVEIMSKYYAIVDRAIAEANDTSRQVIYDRIRAALLAQLRKVEPRLPDAEIKRERLALEEAIRKVEHEAVDCNSPAHPGSKRSVGRIKQQRSWAAPLAVLVLVQAIFLAWLLLIPTPTTQEIDGDLDTVRNQIKQTSAEGEKYESGLLKSLIELRSEMLENTQAMLEQKKISLLRRINLNFKINGRELPPDTMEELRDIAENIEQAEQKLTESEKNATKYSGGLVQAMAMMSVATDQLALAQLRLKYYAAKYGLPAFFPQPGTLKKEPLASPGKVVPDRDAL